MPALDVEEASVVGLGSRVVNLDVGTSREQDQNLVRKSFRGNAACRCQFAPVPGSVLILGRHGLEGKMSA